MKMNEIKVEKQKLLDIIKSNKDEHINEYNEAMRGYRIGVVVGLEQLSKDVKVFAKEIKDALEEARTGGEMKTQFNLNTYVPFQDLIKPESHGKDYETVIGMIELDTSTEVELYTSEYKNYVQDEWAWTDAFEMQITGSSLFNAGSFGYAADSISSYGE